MPYDPELYTAARPLQSSCTLYPLSNYTFDQKGMQREDDPSVAARQMRLENEYHTLGMRRTAEALLLAHDHGHPHALLLQIGGSFFKFPGNQLRPGEDEAEGLKARLNTQLGHPNGTDHPGWEVGEVVAVWWRPKSTDVASFNNIYPYRPAHVSNPREQKKIYLIQLPEKCTFHVPGNMKLLAVPLMEMYDNASRYGNIIASIPQVVSRFDFTYAPPS